MGIEKITELVLENIENLLLEGRVENIKKKYPKPTWEEIDKLVAIDPSPTNKFLEWATKMFLPKTIKWFKENTGNRWRSWRIEEVPDDPEDPRWRENYNISRNFTTLGSDTLSELKDNLEHFFKNPSKYEIKDINQFKTVKEFDDAVEVAKQKLSRKEQKETGVDKVFEDDRFILLMPKTHKASCRYGARTRWCVTTRGYSHYFKNYFAEGPIFFLVDKSQPEKSYSPSYMEKAPDYWKVAIHYKPFNGRLDTGGNLALKYANEMNKQEFVDGANLGNTHIDYWNVQDERKDESVVARYLGGPGRGQKERSNLILNQLKDLMERYTKKVLSDYYDSLDGDVSEVDKLKELQEKIDELNTKQTNMYFKRDRLKSVIQRLTYFNDRLETEEGEDDEYRVWVEEQLKQASVFDRQLQNKLSKIEGEHSELVAKKEEVIEKLNNKKLVFYDKEKNISMGG